MAELPVLAPGATIGILGGGQLGRMLAQAATRLGLRAHVFAPEADSCAFEVADGRTIAAYEDKTALARFAAAVDCVTYEFENIPAAAARFIAARKPVLPDPKVLETTQDRLAEKKFVNRLGIGTAPFAEVNSEADLRAAIDKIGVPAVLKTRRLGYDGKGQAAIRAAGEGPAAWATTARPRRRSVPRATPLPPGPRSARGPRSWKASSILPARFPGSPRAGPRASSSPMNRSRTTTAITSCTTPACRRQSRWRSPTKRSRPRRRSPTRSATWA